MKVTLMVFSLVSAAAASAGFATAADAQVPNLSGRYQCVQDCAAGPLAWAYVTQNGWDLNLVNEAGVPSRAWIDWPGHIWARNWHEGAVYSPDGAAIQFDNGSVWRRVVAVPAPRPYRVRQYRRYRRIRPAPPPAS